ncbi:MAG TPA: CbbQ/NirQ/NorQ/GpvN family protein [Acidimicrobiales bacterium]
MTTHLTDPTDQTDLELHPGDEPFYLPVHNEVKVFRAAWKRELPILLKGPTGCGKTRLVEYMAHLLEVPLHTVSCHEDITSADLVGRYVITGGDTVWQDGPLTRSVREGGICYLDEIVEARQDSTVAIHSLADHRRELTLERQGGTVLRAAPGFALVVSYNPGYQSVLKDLKMSTRQRMVAIELSFPPPDVERSIVMREAGVDESTAAGLVQLGGAIRQLDGQGLKEVASTRTLIAAGSLMSEGLTIVEAAESAVAGPLTDDRRIHDGLVQMIRSYLD